MLSNSSNETNQSSIDKLPDRLLLYFAVIEGSIGIFLNAFILILILQKKSIRQKDYMIFVIFHHLIDLSISLSTFILQPISVTFWITKPLWCKAAGGLATSFVFMEMLLESVVACNRYVSVCHRNRYQQFFQTRNNYVICVSICVLGTFISVAHLANDSLGRVPGLYCAILHAEKFLLTQVCTILLIVIACYSVVAFCYWRIFCVLKKHQQNNSGQSTNLQEDKSLIRYVAASALLPSMTEQPLYAAIILNLVNDSLLPDVVLAIASGIFLLFPLISPVLTLFMVRPIRNEVFDMLERILNRNQIVPIHLEMV